MDFYKNNSNNLVKNYKEKIDNKILNNEELNLEFNKISTEYQKIIDQTIQKIKERKIIVKEKGGVVRELDVNNSCKPFHY